MVQMQDATFLNALVLVGELFPFLRHGVFVRFLKRNIIE